MVYLCNIDTNERLHLLTHHIFGRRCEAVDTCIEQRAVSTIHAAIAWQDQQWQLRDLSRNGTWLDEVKIPTAKDVALLVGQIINFANQPKNNWRVENLDAPCNLLISLNDASATHALSTYYHLLPDGENPAAAMFLCAERNQWVLERRSASEQLEKHTEVVIEQNGLVEVGAFQWRLFLHEDVQKTLDLTSPQAREENCEFQFEVSLDEEHTQLRLKYEQEVVDLGERSHHYLLLHLARLRAVHASQGIDSKNQGWINSEQLAKELGIDIFHLNIQIFRARKQMSEAFPKVLGLNSLLQRRRGEVRFACQQARIAKGEHIDTFSV